MSQIIDFFNGGLDTEGRTLTEILGQSLSWMESNCDYIQWLFPLTEPSNFNPDAPILTQEDIDILRAYCSNGTPQWHRIFDGVAKYLYFMGIRDIWFFDAFDRFEFADNIEVRKGVWLGQFNHNHLRITRMFNFLTLIGWDHYGKALLAFMKKAAADASVELNPRSLEYWEEAVGHD